ncbi:MAG: NADH-quinone oxidoreductase subunit C [Acidobacteria bacterium]|nr:NADH-quinone oxidoreductase subunit C [Acidobacteriota bacterium]
MNAASLIQAVSDRFPAGVTASHSFRGDATVLVPRDFLVEVARTLKEDPAFQMSFLMDLTAVDFSSFGAKQPRAFFASSGVAVRPQTEIPDRDPWPGPPEDARFAVVYHFFSLPLKHRLRLEVPLKEDDPEVDSLTSLWAGADWLEREVWDMFGIRFRGHPNLKRILMYDEFVGYPLRKDYPVNKRQPLIGPVN